MDEHAFPPTGCAVGWFHGTYFAFVICEEFVVVCFSSFAIFVICKIGWYHFECTIPAKMSTGLE